MKCKVDRKPKSSGHQPLEDGGIENDLIFQPIKEHRNTYFVEYTPARPGGYFATLALVFLEHLEFSEISKLMEQECALWLQRYPVPLMVTAFDDTGSVIGLKGYTDCDHLIGIIENGKALYHWKLLKNEELLSGPLRELNLLSVYGDLPFSTKKERREKAISSAKSMGFGLFIIAMWLVVAAVFWELVGFASRWIGYIVIAYSIYKAVVQALKMLGYIKRSKREKQKDAEELRMRHHHYHCELNPEGFMRLRAENFEREARENTQKESETIKRGQAIDPRGNK